MYQLRADEDWSFLTGKELIQLCIGVHDVQLRFDDNICISMQAEEPAQAFQHKSSQARSSGLAGMAGAAVTLVSLLGARVQKAVVENCTTLAIYFANAEELRIYDSSADYESFTVNGPNRLIVV